MKMLSQSECQRWLETNLGKESTHMEVDNAYCVTYALPVDTGVKTALARVVSHAVDTAQYGLFQITTWGIFPSAQNMALFDGYRKSLGENRGIRAAPGHVFGESDVEELECLIGLALYFFWDASLFDGAGSIAIKISHDEFISIRARDKAQLIHFQHGLEGLKLKEIHRREE